MTRAEVVAALVDDLAAEAAALQDILSRITETDWAGDTPAPAWSIHDQVAHLAHFDAITRQAIAEPDDFVVFRDALPDLQTYVDDVGARYTGRSGVEMLEWWRCENADLRDAMLSVDPAVRIPWFGPPMSLPSKITARIMETWAHGQDIIDALCIERAPTARLRHVARIGVLALPNSFRTHGRSIPDTAPYVELVAPDGSRWTWGDANSTDSVRGEAADFCLVVTQRRHVDDTTLDVHGPVAAEWIGIAQAFAGPPGRGRKPGQFSGNAQKHQLAKEPR